MASSNSFPLSFLEALSHSPYGISSAIILSLVYCVQWYLSRPKKLSLPVADGTKSSNMAEAVFKMRTTYPAEPFVLPLDPPRVILPETMVNEIAHMPDDKISFRKSTYKSMLGKYTGFGTSHPQLIKSIKIDLTRNISKTLADLQDEVIHAVGEDIPECHDWTPIKPHKALLNIVAKISGRVFVGLPLCRNETWIDMTIRYTEDVMKGLRSIEKYPGILRPIVAPFNRELREVARYRKRAGKMLASIVRDVQKAKTQSRTNGKSDVSAGDQTIPDLDGQYNMISWILNHFKNDEKVDAEKIGGEQMLVAFAAIHTTSITATQAIYDLASHPEYIAPLRAELMEVSAEEPDGKLRKSSMPKLRKLDSFIKESQRIHPLGVVSIGRLVTAKEGITLSNGLYLPYDTDINICHPQQTSAIPPEHMAKLPSQPSFDEFHPFRYSDLRSQPGEENKHQFVTTTPDSLSFGHGTWACPGRFFASNEIKVILIELIKNFDIALGPNGEGEGGQFKRPATYTIGISNVPDTSANIYFRKKQAS